jgi:hypothetical protein
MRNADATFQLARAVGGALEVRQESTESWPVTRCCREETAVGSLRQDTRKGVRK